MILNNEEMLEIKGGGSSTSIYFSLAIIGGAIAFFAGIIDGIIHPKEC